MKKRLVVVLVRVSTTAQDWERQRRKVAKILAAFGLEALKEIALKVSGTVVSKTAEYREAAALLRRADVAGLVIPSLDRWFRYKMLGDIALYIAPFEQMGVDGKTKLIFCTINENEMAALDLTEEKDQGILLDAVRYASKERGIIAGRLSEGKDIGREDPECCIDSLPEGVEFEPHEKQKLDADGNKRTLVKGSFRYTAFAHNSVVPLAYRWLAGEKLNKLWKELGFKTNMGARHALRNPWWLGFKHRTKTVTKKEWSTEKNRFRHQAIMTIEAANNRKEFKGIKKTSFMVATNLAATPLLPQDVFDAVQAKLAVRLAEYGTRKKLVDGCLASPLCHCFTCFQTAKAKGCTVEQALAASRVLYGRKGSGHRSDYYTCAARLKKTCDGPIFRQKELDYQIVYRFVKYMLGEGDDAIKGTPFIDALIAKAQNPESRAAALANVETKRQAVVKLEKAVRNLAVMARAAEDPTELQAEFNKATRELGSAKNDVLIAQGQVSDILVVDEKALRAEIVVDLNNFYNKPVAIQKAVMAKYCAMVFAVPDSTGVGGYKAEFIFKYEAPGTGNRRTMQTWDVSIFETEPTDGTTASVRAVPPIAAYRNSERGLRSRYWRPPQVQSPEWRRRSIQGCVERCGGQIEGRPAYATAIVARGFPIAGRSNEARVCSGREQRFAGGQRVRIPGHEATF